MVIDVVTSPTFVVMRLYETEYTSITTLVHIDAYRIEDEQEIEVLNIKALLDTPQTLVCIEWPQQIPKYFLLGHGLWYSFQQSTTTSVQLK